MGKNWQIWGIVSYLFICLANIHRYTENVFGILAYALTVAYSPNFSSPVAFTCMVCQNSPAKYFPCIVHMVVHRVKKELTRILFPTIISFRLMVLHSLNTSFYRSDIFVFLLSTRAGGLGINLTAADTVTSLLPC